jgi:hypothetical protein
VNESDLPGNRPEDRFYDEAWDIIGDEEPGLHDEDPEEFHRLVEAKTRELVDAYYAADPGDPDHDYDRQREEDR